MSDLNLVNSIEPSLEEPLKENRSFDPSKDFVDLVFAITEETETNKNLVVKVTGGLAGKQVGFEVQVLDKTSGIDVSSQGKVKEMRITPNGVAIRSTGENSDNFVQILGNYYGQSNPPSKMVNEVFFTSIALGDDPKQIFSHTTNFKLFYEKHLENKESREARAFHENEYFEVYLNFDLPSKRVYFKEKDPKFRKQLLKAFGV